MQTQVHDDQLVGVAKITQLTNLNLTSPLITDDGMLHLTSLENLELLYLDSCRRLTNETLRSVSKLPKLRTLRADGLSISNDGLEHLRGMTSLKSVEISGPDVTWDAVTLLRESLSKSNSRGLGSRFNVPSS